MHSKKPRSGAPRPKLLLSPKDGKTIAITGGIATGKSFVLQCFEQLGFKVFNADREIHKMLMRGGAAFDEVSKLFPDAVTAEGIDRKVVGEDVFKSKEKLVALEKILHPKIQQAQLDMVIENKKGFQQTLVFEIPLLFENNRHKNFDYVITVTAPKEVQKERVLARNNMTEDKFNAIMERQVSDSIRLKSSHFVIRTGKGKEDTIRQIKSIIKGMHSERDSSRYGDHRPVRKKRRQDTRGGLRRADRQG